MQHPAKASGVYGCERVFEGCGGLADTSAGRRKYREYLAWLPADASAQKELLFDRVCRGWAIGSKDFKKDLLSEEAERVKAGAETSKVIESR